MKQPEERTAEEKMALLGKPKLGEVFRAQIRIKESKEFKNTVDKLVQRANASILLGESILFFFFSDLKNSLEIFLEDSFEKKFERFQFSISLLYFSFFQKTFSPSSSLTLLSPTISNFLVLFIYILYNFGN